MTDVNNLIVKNQEQTEAEIRRQWEAQDRNRRTRTLSQNWPNRAIYEAQLERIKNVNKSQGTPFKEIILFFSLIGFAKYRRSSPVKFATNLSPILPEFNKIKLN